MTAILFKRKYGMPLLLSLYELGSSGPTALALRLRAHPASVIATLRGLEAVGIVRQTRRPRDRRALEVRLTVRGLELAETALSHWNRVIRKWDSLR